MFLLCRNVSSAGDYGRKKLRECEGLVDSLIFLVRSAIERANIDNKSVENAVCVLRNLSYRAQVTLQRSVRTLLSHHFLQEIEDPNYDKRQLPGVGESRAAAKPASDNLGCFGASKNKSKTSLGGGGSGARSGSLGWRRCGWRVGRRSHSTRSLRRSPGRGRRNHTTRVVTFYRAGKLLMECSYFVWHSATQYINLSHRITVKTR